MKTFTLILALLQTIYFSAQSQNLKCITETEFQKNIESNALWKQNHEQLEQFTRSYIQSHSGNSTNQVVYVIPVVVHILHQYGPENISDWQVIDGINRLTADFRKLNADTAQIILPFKPIAADCEIEFRLATLDPNGNCTNGIDRIFTPLTINANDNSKLNPWPNNMYLNIWTAASLENLATYCYAHIPGGPNNTDGIMMSHEVLGSIGTGQLAYNRMLTHEMGHYLNLRHLYQTGMLGVVCGDDSIADTPETKGWDHCDLNGSVCNPPIIENVQNFMEFSYCSVMFTAGQKAWMQGTLNSPISGRNNLSTPANLAATGTVGPPIIACSPIAQFTTTQFGCTGDLITFNSINSNVPFTSWSWTFPGGNPSASTDSTPTVLYNAPGYYDAKLVVTNAMGIDSISKTAVVYISDTAQLSIPYSEDFESPSSFPGIDGWIENTDSSVFQWARTSSANATIGGSNSIKIDNFSNSRYQSDSWVTPSINFSNVTFPIRVYFQVANAQRVNNREDELKVFYSFDCGKNWFFSTYSKSGAALSTAGIVSTDFTPSSNQWRQESFVCNQVQNQPNVRFRFTNISDNGNNVFIDDINITGNIVGIDEMNELQNGFTIYPNPSNDFSYINFNLIHAGKVTISLKNLLGETILNLNDEILQTGNHEIKMPSQAQGIYFVVVTVNGRQFVRKWVVE